MSTVAAVAAQGPDLINLAVGLVGALMGAGATLVAVVLQQNAADRRRRVDEEERILGFLKAIEVEVEMIVARYEYAIGPRIRSAPEGEAINEILPPIGDYFTVYNASASLLGSVRNDEIRAAIVQFYTLARALVETIGLNSRIAGDLADAKRANLADPDRDLAPVVEALRVQLNGPCNVREADGRRPAVRRRAPRDPTQGGDVRDVAYGS